MLNPDQEMLPTVRPGQSLRLTLESLAAVMPSAVIRATKVLQTSEEWAVPPMGTAALQSERLAEIPEHTAPEATMTRAARLRGTGEHRSGLWQGQRNAAIYLLVTQQRKDGAIWEAAIMVTVASAIWVVIWTGQVTVVLAA